VPEAAVDEDGNAGAGEDDVGPDQPAASSHWMIDAKS